MSSGNTKGLHGMTSLIWIRELSECCGQERWEESKEEEGECLRAGSMEETIAEHSRAQVMELCVRNCAASEEPQGMGGKHRESGQGTKRELRRDIGRQEHGAKRDRNYKQCVP